MPLYANDVIYGGLGSDSIHGGAGDDAISGAEALTESYTNSYAVGASQPGTKLNPAPIRSDYDHPRNPGNVLGYSASLTYQAQYDPNDPFRAVTLNADGSLNKTGSGLAWLLGFDPSDGPIDGYWAPSAGFTPAVATDGNDIIFGDLGNDWQVGGTGRDIMFGGWGNDYLNADDLPSSQDGLNSGPDTNPSWEDFVYGGAGLDVMLANTAGDRLIDWSGEFNSYLVPFDPFGMPTISREPSPNLRDLLYAFSKSSGADQLLQAIYSSDPARNGEPFGEIALVDHEDAAWGDQHAGPRDPQPGHEHNHRDIHRTANVLPIGSGPDITASQVNRPAPDPIILAPAITAAATVGAAAAHSFQLRFAGAAGAALHWTVGDGLSFISGDATIGADGYATFAVDLSSLQDGLLTIGGTETDAFGNVETYADGHVTKDTTAPAAPAVALDAPSDSGVLGDWITNVGSPSFVVTGEPGATAAVYVDGVLYTGGSLTNGTHTVTATLTDAYGNTSAASASQTLNISGASTLVTSIMLNNGLSLVNHHVVTFGIAATSTAGDVTVAITVNGSLLYTGLIGGAPTSLTLATEGLYTVEVTFTDSAANSQTLTRSVTLDLSGPNLTVSMSPPTNGMYYDIGGGSTLTWIVTDANGVGVSSGSIEGQTISSSGGMIDLDLLTAGTHTVTVTAYDAAGNHRQVSLNFTIRVTAQGLKSALVDGFGRGWVPNAAFQATLLSQIQAVVDVAGKNGNTAHVRLRNFISTVTGASTTQLSASFKALLLNWAADLDTRL